MTEKSEVDYTHWTLGKVWSNESLNQDRMTIPSFSADWFNLVSKLEKWTSELVLFFRWIAEER